MKPTDVVVTYLRRMTAAALLTLLAASWRLWLPTGDYPQIPWLPALCSAPSWIDIALLAGLACSIIVTLLGGTSAGWTRCTSLATAATLGGLLALDQHRLQPWAYQFLLLAMILAAAPGMRGIRCARAIVISIYLWSSASKIDPGFLESHGQMLLDGLLKSVGLSERPWSEGQRRFAAGLMPAGELLIAILLAVPRWRGCGVWASSAMHLTLLLALGPWGLGHEVGVLLWNVYFIGQNAVLFRRDIADEPHATDPPRAADWGGRLATVIAAGVVLAPLSNPLGWWDHWPSWSVYSAHPEIVQMYVEESAAEKLPTSLQSRIDPPEPLQSWRRVRLDQWSFDRLAVPPYPQGRWKLALIAALAERAGLNREVHVDLLTRESWWNPARRTIELPDVDAVRSRLAEAIVNTQPRQ